MFREYGVPHERWRGFTVDHLVPIELGGEPFGVVDGRWDLRNVWPQPKAEARRKDAVEDALHAAVCNRRGYRGASISISSRRSARSPAIGIARRSGSLARSTRVGVLGRSCEF